MGDYVPYDVDAVEGRREPEQLEATPITKYGSDPGLVIGRQIAVNMHYVCYGLKCGNVRILNPNAASRSLLRGHSKVFCNFEHTFLWQVVPTPVAFVAIELNLIKFTQVLS